MDKIRSVVFLLPGVDKKPVGGVKVIYEYSNRFINDGWKVYLLYPQMLYKDKSKKLVYILLRRIKNYLVFIYRKLTRIEKKIPSWFQIDNRVYKEYVWKLNNSKILNNKDLIIIATALPTAFELQKIRPNNMNNFYFVQDFESWGTATDEDVYNSFQLPLNKITITPWLRDMVRKVGSDAVVVENGLDFDYFKLTIPIKDRSPFEISMLYHLSEPKRSQDAIEALKLVKERVPQLHVTMFGVPIRPNVPDWFEYYQTPSKEIHNRIYNKAAIFVAPSRLEGMGLTPAESMICGCAVACTDNPGFDVFAKHNETALISPAMNIKALADNILKLIHEKELRLRIAKTGNEYIGRFTWEIAYLKFKNTLEQRYYGEQT